MNNVILSQDTVSVLKNFATINASILFRKGNVLKTISVGENCVAEYVCEENFPQTFGIYDLNQFMVGMTLFQNQKPVLVFENEEYVTIKGRGKSARYYFSNPEITLKAAPEKQLDFPGADMEFFIDSESLSELRKASIIYAIPDLRIASSKKNNKLITLSLLDKDNETSNVYSQEFKGETTGEYELFLKMDSFVMLPGNYNVKISNKLITEWKHSALNLTYYIALEP